MSINERVLVGTYGVVTIQAKDWYGNNRTSGGGGFKVSLINNKASELYSGTPYDNDDGKYMFPFQLEVAGTYQINITYNGVQLIIGQEQIVVLRGSTEAVSISYITPTLVPAENYTTLTMFGDNLMQIISFSCIFGDFEKRPGRFNTSQETLQCDTPYIKESLTVQLAVQLTLYQGKSTFNFGITFYVDRPPIAMGDRIWSWQNSFVSFSPLLNDQVAYGSPNLLGVCQDPKNGTVEVVGSSLRYTPRRNFTGSDKLTYTISDFRDLIAHGDVIISVYALAPQIVSSPQVLVELEDQPIPSKGGIQGLEIANPNIAEIVTIEVQAGNGRLKFAEDSTHLWQGVHILSYDTLDESKPNGTKPSLKFTGTFTLVSSALQALRYQGEAYFNGNDFIKLYIYNRRLEGSSRDILVMLQAKNDPPFINSSTLLFLNSTYWKAVNAIPIEGISIGDPDQRDVQGSSRELHLQIALEVSTRSIQILINSSAISTVRSQEEGSNVWITKDDHSGDEERIMVVGSKIKFEDNIESCNNALKSLKLLRGNPKGLKSILLTITVNDLGNFGCYGDCTTNSTLPLQEIMHMTIIFEFVPPDVRAKVAASLTCSLVFIIYVTILMIRYRRSLAYKFDDGTLSEEDMLKKTRVFNPAWSTDAKRESSFDFGVSRFIVEKEDKFVETLFEPPIIYEGSPHEADFSSLSVHQSESNESTASEKQVVHGKIRKNIFLMD